MRRFDKNIVVLTGEEADNYQFDAEQIVIVVDPSVDFGPSSSGKSVTVAKTEGYRGISNIWPKFKMNLHIFRT